MSKTLFTILIGCLIVATVPAWAEDGFTVSGEFEFEKSGSIFLQLVTKDQFENDTEGTAHVILTVGDDEEKAGKVSFILENVPAGTYAITAFQDVDGDKELTSGRFGPKEPWGTYQHHRPKFSGPKFKKMAFEVKEDIGDISITLK